MTALSLGGWMVKALQWLPQPLHRALDGWSRRVARQRLEKRRKRRQPH